MTSRDLHIHTNFCDGKDAPEKYVESAIEKGLSCIGFSVHSYTEFDTSYCIKKERISEYCSVIKALRNRYKNKITILCGTELDYYSTMPTEGFDYIIGSVHYVEKNGKYLPVDLSKDEFCKIVRDYFDGDFYSFCEAYYKNVAELSEKTRPDIIGHFDLVSKFNKGEVLFSEKNERYVEAYTKAAEKLASCGIPFEINTGGISRGYKTTPYPNEDIMKLLSRLSAKGVLSSDSHSHENVAFGFEEAKKYAENFGVKLI